MLARGRLEKGVEDPRLDVDGEERIEDGDRIGLELVEREGRGVLVRRLETLDDLEREDADDLRGSG